MSQAATEPGGQAEGATVVKLKGIRRTAARRMVTAWEAPVFHLTVEVDMTRALAVRECESTATVTDVVLLACATALSRHPEVNAHYGEEAVTRLGAVNVGMAVATEAGLMVPVLHGADGLGLAGVAEKRRDLATRAREGKLGMVDVTGGTFTVSNLGMMGVDRFDAILNVPQVAILAVGSTKQRQVWNGGDPKWRPIAELTLTCDHRALDGAAAARFLATVREQVEAGA